MLENDSLAFDAPGGRFHVAGLADMRHRRPDVAARARGRARRRARADARPRSRRLPVRARARVALTVAGHTHGGQIALPYVRRPFIPSRHGERYARGHVVEHGRHLVVGAGLGTSGLPIRLLAPPELLVLELLPG